MTLLMWVGRLEILPVLLLLRQLLAPREPLVLGQLDE
jgi:Trk-type K+ transport system membrane component